MNQCQCSIQEASNNCEGGMRLFNWLSDIVRSNHATVFYSLLSAERRKGWEEFNKRANAYLEHINYQIQPDEEQQDLATAVLVWKLELVQHDETKHPLDRVIEWVKEGLNSSQLDNNIEGQQMGFDYDSAEWRGYSAALGVVWANHYHPYQPGWTKEKV
jgi:hypothetical protein